MIRNRLEYWLPVVGFEGWYEVSNFGNVRRIRRARGTRCRLLKPVIRGAGYLYVTLYKKGKSYSRTVHSLVCEAFHGPRPTSKHETNHKGIDGNKRNNNEWNLEWATKSQNEKHKNIILGKRTPSGSQSKIAKNYILVNPQGVHIEVCGLKKFCKDNNLDFSALLAVKAGRQKSSRGWVCLP